MADHDLREWDAQVDAAEDNGIRARWEYGRALLLRRSGKKLPDGLLDSEAEKTGKSRSELKHRMNFAQHIPDDEALANAVSQWGSWHEIVNGYLASTAHLSSEKDEWATPDDLFAELDAEFGFTLDVCASAGNAKCERYFSKADNALVQDWQGVCWMNPPYSEIDLWMVKAREAGSNGATVVCLVPCRTDVAWFWDVARSGEIRLLRGRLHFVDDEDNTGPAPFPSCLVVFGHESAVTWYDR